MRTITGRYGTAKIFTDMVDDRAAEQIQTLMGCRFMEGSDVRIMPDVHAGKGCTIGTSISDIDGMVCPNLVGVDIGCGMRLASVKGLTTTEELEELDRIVRKHIPSGFAVRREVHELASDFPFDQLCAPVTVERARKSAGSLGSGNHFIEVDTDPDTGYSDIVIHSGSRHLGVEVAEFHQKRAIRQCRDSSDPDRNSLPDGLCYLSGDLYDDYINDMRLAQRFAALNREIMIRTILDEMGISTVYDTIDSVHNFIDMDDMTLRKGATSARKGQRLLIPINMRDGTLVCEGKGNKDWNCSAPHGAGRQMSRKKASDTISMDEYRQSMQGIYSSSISEGTLDEAPMAYKPMSNLLDNIGDTVKVLKVIKPVYNFKASSGFGKD